MWLIVMAVLWFIGLVVYLVQLGAARIAARELDPEPCNPLLERRLDAIPLPAHLASPQVVAGQDLDDSLLIREIYKACDDYRHAVDIFVGARHEQSPEVKR
jgi:hypothetical protein